MPKRTDISSLPLIGAGPVAKCSGVSLPTDLSVSPRLRRNRSCRALQPPYRGAGLSRRSSHPRSRLADQTLSHAPTPAHNDAMPVHRNPAGDRHKVSLAPGNCFPVVFAAFRSATRQHPLAILPARPMTTINPQRGPAPMLSQRDRAQLWSARSTHWYRQQSFVEDGVAGGRIGSFRQIKAGTTAIKNHLPNRFSLRLSLSHSRQYHLARFFFHRPAIGGRPPTKQMLGLVRDISDGQASHIFRPYDCNAINVINDSEQLNAQKN